MVINRGGGCIEVGGRCFMVFFQICLYVLHINHLIIIYFNNEYMTSSKLNK